MQLRYIAFFVFTLLFFSCQKDNEDKLDTILHAQIKQYSKYGDLSGLTLPNNLKDIPQDPLNTLTEEKVNLGKLLFHETYFSIKAKKTEHNRTYSCASCHHAQAGFQACLPQGIGEGGIGFGSVGESRLADLSEYDPELLDVQPIRSPSAMNVAYQKAMLWNGQFGATGPNIGTDYSWTEGTPKSVNHLGFEGVESQAIAGLDVHRIEINSDLVESIPEYKALFDDAFDDYPVEERYSNITGGLAIAAYERTLLSTDAPFQAWLKGDKNAMTKEQKKGAILFFGKAQCFNCHDGPALNSMEFHALGMKDLEGPLDQVFTHALDKIVKEGRGGFTGRETDLYTFKVPQLYSLKYSPFYGHGSSFKSIKEVIEYKNKAVKENNAVSEQYLSDQFIPLRLSQKEIDQLTDFVLNGLDDKNLLRFLPDELPSGNCFPNNDDQSKIDLGCN